MNLVELRSKIEVKIPQEYRIGTFKILEVVSKDKKKDEVSVKGRDYTYFFNSKLKTTEGFGTYPLNIETLIEKVEDTTTLPVVLKKPDSIANINYMLQRPVYVKDEVIGNLISQIAKVIGCNIYVNGLNNVFYKKLDTSNVDFRFLKSDIFEQKITDIEVNGFNTVTASRISNGDNTTTEDVFYSIAQPEEKKKEYLVISFLPFIMLIYAIIFTNPFDLIKGMKHILLSDGVLLTDYFIVGGKGAAMFNASIVALINIFLLYRMDMKINGLLISGIYIMFGFAFMGKNLLNIIPFYLGAYAYTQFEKRSFKTVIASCMFTTALSPVVSSISKAFNFSFFGIILAILAGFLMGFIVPAVSAHVINFHNGYTLYNTGLGAGLIAIIIYAILEEVGLEVTPNKTFVEKMDYSILALLILVFSFYIIYGYYANGHSFKNFGSLLMHSGRLVTDFTVTEGFPMVMINMGILGFIALALIFLMFPYINGPILSGLLTLIGFSGFGKHLKNVLPIIAGVSLSYIIFGKNISLTSFAITLFFSTCLAPISGKFGIIPGIIVGFVNFCLVLNMGALHGGLNLYNTGLSAGIVASVSVPILQLFYGGKK